MSDLISRKQISNYIKAQINPYGKPFEGTTYELGLKIMEYIDNMNSAYDVDKVVKELEEVRQEHEENASKTSEMSVLVTELKMVGCYSHAIKIIKGGGVNERE